MQRKSYNIENHLHYFTFSCYRKEALLVNETERNELLTFWREASGRAQFEFVAYVVMPNHAHLLVRPPKEYEVARLLRRLKEPFSHWLVRRLQDTNTRILNRITVTVGSRRLHRVWQRGGGYDRNLYSRDAINRAIEYIEFNPVAAGLVTTPELWRWSSAFARKSPTESLLPVIDMEEIETVR